MDLQQLEEEARQAALKDIKNMLQRPGQLEKVEQYRHRVARKKASVEALLKTGMQNQLEGVRVGLKQLKTCLEDVREVKRSIKEVEKLMQGVPELYDALEDVREENTKHSQLATAVENIKHIFNVETSVQKTMALIDEDKLLNAHQCLADLESARDDLLYELHKQPKQHASDKITLKRHFEKIDTVAQALEKKLRLILSRTLNTVRKEPKFIVTALRIIEREEKNDQFALQQEKVTSFRPPGRPRQWRAMAMNVLKEAVITRIEGSRMEEREDNKMWLVRDLEVLRQNILVDLRVVKSLCVPCFPPHYNIFEEYVRMYHEGLSNYIENIASGLQGNEYVSLLSWVINTYPGYELMRHPELNVNIQQLVGPLLPPSHLRALEDEYLGNMQKNFNEWMANTAEKDRSQWFSEQTPDQDEQYYHSPAAVILFEMINQLLQVTETIHSDLTFKALVMSIRQLDIFGQTYLKHVVDLKDHHFRNRDQIKFFTHHIIAIVNNSQQILDLAQQLKQKYWPNARTEHYEDFEKLLETFQLIRTQAAGYLLEEAFLDLDGHFNELFTPKWLTSTISVDTICITLEDYFQDYNHLTPCNFEMVINEAQKQLAKRYIRAMLSKRLSRPTADCEAIKTKINQEAKRLERFFEKIAPNLSLNDSPLKLISMLSSLLVCDLEVLLLDLHTLLGNYPSLTEEQIVRLFYIRNDVKAAEVRQKVQDANQSKKPMVTIDKQDCIFKEIVFNDKLW
ncbi:exocyst complex component 3-like [Musca vetustissima]|uniref:exocyst complex component 3-like n=1 Tax=Musca vetustissima TaxID=27455 RepID=UPI002AB7E29B|nr:exocyst complex component 3-like [Musca vetustissima]XP_061398856.1 exocyst complex component 3-like [Musca vetustissima]